MSTIPHVAVEYDNGVSCHFSGIQLVPEGFWVEFSIREGLDGSDLIVLRQEVVDFDHQMPLDEAVNIARRILSEYLSKLALDVLNAEIVDDEEGD